MATSHPFESKLLAAWPASAWKDHLVVVAVSAGPDSVALLRALHRIRSAGNGRLLVAHFNHGWRGEDSDADEAFVKALCGSLQLDCRVERAEPAATSPSEDLARRQRYDFFHRLVKESGARHIVTAHTLDDQVETVLMRIFRGTGIAGLIGIRAVRQLSSVASLIRPLLTIQRQEILDYLNALHQQYRLDRSNDDLSFRRNRLRHVLLPELAKHFNPEVQQAVVRLAGLAGEVDEILSPLVERLFESAVTIAESEVIVARRMLSGVPDYLVRELFVQVWKRQAWPLQAMGHSQWQQLRELAAVEGDSIITLPGAVRAERQSDSIRLSRPNVQ